MLKIRDDVDLKELEKFGFKEGLDDGCHKALIKNLEYNDYIAVYEDKHILVDIEDLMVDEEELALGDILKINDKGILSKSGTDQAWQVVKVYTMPDGQRGVKVMRVE